MNDFLLAPLVIAQRMPLLWLEAMQGKGNDGGSETKLMVDEKMTAMQQGIVDSQLEAFRFSLQMSLAMFTGAFPSKLVSQAPGRMARAALRPAARTVKANAKRLART